MGGSVCLREEKSGRRLDGVVASRRRIELCWLLEHADGTGTVIMYCVTCLVITRLHSMPPRLFPPLVSQYIPHFPSWFSISGFIFSSSSHDSQAFTQFPLPPCTPLPPYSTPNPSRHPFSTLTPSLSILSSHPTPFPSHAFVPLTPPLTVSPPHLNMLA